MKKNEIKTTLMKAYVWMWYIISLPLMIPFTLGLIIWLTIKMMIGLKEFNMWRITKELLRGYYIGHKNNMNKVEMAYGGKSFEELNWYFE